jgi:hypothetical protein
VQIPDGTGTGRDVAFSPDGRLALVAGKVAQLYRTQNWEPVGDPLPHEWGIIQAAFSPDGHTLVTSMRGPRPGLIGRSPGRLRFWDVATRKQIGEPIPLERFGSPLVFDATGDILLAGEWLCKVRTRELIERRSLKVGEGERAVAQLVAHRPDSRMPPLWDFEKDEPTRLRMPEDDVVAARLTPDAKRLLTTRRDGSARLWDVETGKPLGPRFRAEGSRRQLSPDGKSVLFGTRTTLRLWDPYTGRPRGESLINQQAQIHAAFSPSGDMLATLWHFTAQLRDSGTGQALTPLLVQPTSGGGAVLFTPDGEELLVLSRGVQRWRVPTPAADEPERLKLSVEVRTGLEIDENGVLQKLTRLHVARSPRRSEKVSEATDIFSLGAIAYHLFTSRPPAGSINELQRILREQNGLSVSATQDGVGPKLEEFIQEGEALGKIRSEFIIDIYDCIEIAGKTVLVLQKAGEESLAKHLRKYGVPSLPHSDH